MKVYLDNGATTQVDEKVAKEMQKYFVEEYGNPSSVHDRGQTARRLVAEAREKIAGKLNAKYDEIIFTSGGTESDNMALKGVAFLDENKGKHIITTTIEHPAVLNTCKYLEKKGYRVSYIPVDKEGFLDIEKLQAEIYEDTVLVSVIHGNNEIGTIQDIDKIGKICKDNNVLFHIDAVQSFTKVPIDVKKTNVDLISISSHKIHGPKGVGALYVRKGVKLEVLNHGGEHEFKRRAGTENVPGIMGFAKAVSLGYDAKKVVFLRDYFISELFDKIENIVLNGPEGDSRLCNNVNMSFANIEGEALGAYMDISGICTSNGSACSSHTLEPSHVLIASHVSHELANGTLRMTLSKYTTKEEIDYTVSQLVKYVEKLRKVSPLRKVINKMKDKKE